MEKISSVVQEVLVDEFEYVYTIETLEDFGLEKNESLQIPGPIFGSKSKHIQWSLAFLNLGTMPITLKHLSQPELKPDYHFRIVAKGQRTLEGNPLAVKVAVSLPSASSECGTARRVDFPKNQKVLVSTSMDFFGSMARLPLKMPIIFNFKVMQRKCTAPESCMALKTCIPASVLQTSFRNLLDSGDFTDVTLATSNGTIQAHKLLLMARSPVFRAMFATDMMETSSNRVEINDFDQETVSAMLEYIYTGHTDQVTKSPREMLHIADKYDLKELREVCISFVANELKVDNAVENLVLADRFQVKDLKRLVMQFFITNHLEIVKTEDFREFIKTNHELYLEAMTGNFEVGK